MYIDTHLLWATDAAVAAAAALWVARTANCLSPTVSKALDATLGPVFALGQRGAPKAAQASKLDGVSAEVVARRMRDILFGLDDVVETMAAAVLAGAEKKGRSGPLVTALVTGPALSGKTTAAYALAGGAYKGDDQVWEIDVAKLGAVGALGSLQGRLTEFLAKDDEIVIAIRHAELAAADDDFIKALTALVVDGKVSGKKLAKNASVVVTAGDATALPKKLRAAFGVTVSTKPLSGVTLDKVVRAHLADFIQDEPFKLTLGIADDAVISRLGVAWGEGREAVTAWLADNVSAPVKAAKARGETAVSLYWADGQVVTSPTKAGGGIKLSGSLV